MQKRIAAITTVRNDRLFLPKWISYYAQQFGEENLFVILDGHDQEPPEHIGRVNVLRLPHIPKKRTPAMKRRARIMSKFAQGLHHHFDIVMATDVDEFLILDPKRNESLAEYLSTIKGRSTVSGLGLDVGQHLDHESVLNTTKPFLDQRRFAHLSSRYTKPVVSFQPITWGGGLHRVKGRNYHIDPNLFHFHFGMVDYEHSTGKTADEDRLNTGWKHHLKRRHKLFQIIAESTPIPGDEFFEEARRIQTRRRYPLQWNKPRLMKNDPVVIIPPRFKGIV